MRKIPLCINIIEKKVNNTYKKTTEKERKITVLLIYAKKLEKYGKIKQKNYVGECGMLNFVICEDEPILLKKYANEIDKFMMRYDMDYKCHTFVGYDERWKKYAKKEDGFKIYLLDIKTANGSGLDAARLIREEYDDWCYISYVL